MTDQEKDKLIVEALGECWHEWEALSNQSLRLGEDYCYMCHNYRLEVEEIPNLTTWEGFGWWWERAQKMEWWDNFWGYLCDTVVNKKIKLPDYADYCFTFYFIDPTRGRDALAEFLIGRTKP